jgi:hypothetical protein
MTCRHGTAGECERCRVSSGVKSLIGLKAIAAKSVAKAPNRTKTPITECSARGEPTGETVPCRTCRGEIRLKVFACSKHGRCTLGNKAVDGVHLCDGCG